MARRKPDYQLSRDSKQVVSALMEMAASSNDSAKILESKYEVASAVIVSNFVSVKLYLLSSSAIVYKVWKAQMVCLIESQELVDIINTEHPSSPFDKLVKGWILSTLNDGWLKEVQDLGTAREVWMKLESHFNPPKRHTEEDDHAQKYREALAVKVSDYVSMNLSGRSNYHIWKAQMLSLIEDKKLLHIIISEYPFPKNKGDHMIPKYDKLVKGWIFATVEYQLLEEFIEHSSVQSIWRELESRYNRPISYKEQGDSVDVSALREDLKYIQASNINVSNFVSVKLSGYKNYFNWKAQMACLLKSQELLPENRLSWNKDMTRKYDKLVRGWILGTMNDQLLQTFSGYLNAKMLWDELETMFNSQEKKEEEKKVRFESGIESVNGSGVEKKKSTRQQEELYKAAVEGCWWKAKSILKLNKNAATEAIPENGGNTVLHVAVEMGHNYFVQKLLDFLKDGNVVVAKNDKGQTALHTAAIVGNKYAAQLLVKKREELLVILDNNKESPLDISYANMMLDVSTYLLKLASNVSNYPYASMENAIFAAILTKQYDLSEKLLKTCPELARDNNLILKAITITFPNDLGFWESFVYPSFHNLHQKLGGSLLIQSNYMDKCVEDILRLVNNTCSSWLGKVFMIFLVPIATFYTIYQLLCLLILVLRLPFSMLYCIMWKVFVVNVRLIKNIERKKIEYKAAKEVLKFICEQMGTSNYKYIDSIIEALRLDTYEVVDEILFNSPDTVNFKLDEEGHNIIQLTILNRSEKVYNLIYHIIESNRRTNDASKNNLAHLAGRLAPSSVLGHTTGAALQLQRELIWREEVEKLMSPLELRKTNIYMETPAMTFTREHEDLIKQGECWMKTTAESCSITAALVVTIVFAAAITVPGGSNQESGKPVFNKEIAFTIFAVFNAFSLFTAATALLLFLSILTARFSEKDFLRSLPTRLIFGLLTLFLSTTSMIVAFGAVLFLVVCDHRPWMLGPICVFSCFPISVIVTIKLPLLVDLIGSTYSPIFGKKSYLETCQIQRKSTIVGRERKSGDIEDQLLNRKNV